MFHLFRPRLGLGGTLLVALVVWFGLLAPVFRWFARVYWWVWP